MSEHTVKLKMCDRERECIAHKIRNEFQSDTIAELLAACRAGEKLTESLLDVGEPLGWQDVVLSAKRQLAAAIAKATQQPGHD